MVSTGKRAFPNSKYAKSSSLESSPQVAQIILPLFDIYHNIQVIQEILSHCCRNKRKRPNVITFALLVDN